MRSVLFLGVAGLALLGAIVAVTSSHSQATHIESAPFTLDGKPARGDGTTLMHEGQLLRVTGGAAALRVTRLECKSDTHRIPLSNGAWRVPDLPTGEYQLAGNGPKQSFVSLVTVHSHDAPCPGA
jgi:hypothetical protein